MREPDLNYPDCPIRNILCRMSDKWSLLVLIALQNGSMRYKNLREAIPDISQKMLTNTLKRLVEDNLISRRAYPEIPPRVEYSLTENGKSLMPPLHNLINWAKQNFEKVVR